MKYFFIFLFIISFSTTVFCQTEKEYYADGKLKAEGILSNGEKTGLWKFYYPDQTLSAEENYKDGMLHGKRKTYDFQGKLLSIENWAEGMEEDSTTTFYPNGQVHRKGINRN